MKPNLKPHQEEAIQFLNERDNACGGIFFDPGLGKTLIMLEHLKRNNLTPALVICPTIAIDVWAQEVEKFEYPFKVLKLYGSKAVRYKNLYAQADIKIINYEGLKILEHEWGKVHFKTVIWDESHRCKNLGAIQTDISLKLSARVAFRYILSGTPITKNPLDIWAQCQLVKPWHLGLFLDFKHRYVEYRKQTIYLKNGLTKTIQVPYRFKHLEELEKNMAELCIRRTKEEVLADLPEKIYRTVYCDMAADQLAAYRTLKNGLAVMLKDGTFKPNNGAAKVGKLRQMTGGFVYDQEKRPVFYKSNAKIKMLKDLLEDLNDKVIIYYYYRGELTILKEALKSQDKRVIVYEEAGSEGIADYQNTPDNVIFLCQVEQAISITLTSGCNTIYYSNSWSDSTRVQSEDRQHRIGQVRNVTYWDLVARNSIDEHVINMLKVKKHMADKITGDAERLAKSYIGGFNDSDDIAWEEPSLPGSIRTT